MREKTNGFVSKHLATVLQRNYLNLKNDSKKLFILPLFIITMLFVQQGFGQTVNQTFTYTGSAQSFIVPAGVTSVTVRIWGAGGAGSGGPSSGGSGAFLKGTLAVTPGNTLTIVVGGAGVYGTTGVNLGGYGGGGNSGGPYGSSGGGYSGIFSSSTLTQANALAIAGGGGGGGYYSALTYGGAGGATTGTNGGDRTATTSKGAEEQQ